MPRIKFSPDNFCNAFLSDEFLDKENENNVRDPNTETHDLTAAFSKVGLGPAKKKTTSLKGKARNPFGGTGQQPTHANLPALEEGDSWVYVPVPLSFLRSLQMFAPVKEVVISEETLRKENARKARLERKKKLDAKRPRMWQKKASPNRTGSTPITDLSLGLASQAL
mmetsp:Transcript_26670/g.43610  ORF Transcript_26670/g.43610 Transcript_26670/m.43610 type:complete len:167 (-) Transcript_26670:433-933(-)|eukprot:CAMPEP_0184669388 /NCGR_PEP_ID=MMETSP0308-20130426/77117_1 /TAXON_ID=38269 /ORGANISM="Gloeochaete witrockiana, Strain SAG 46.84" /LENGTH=166 /DNA_ID=CAMNT_0027115617 /DNA_START=49 /DNA_END=549 /DNA_ORIENTATION=+